MTILLPLLALAAPIDDINYECRIERTTPAAGSLFARQVLPNDPSGHGNVHHNWIMRSGRIFTTMHWGSPQLAAPGDVVPFNIVLTGVPRGVDTVRAELWRGGKRIAEQVGYWTSLGGLAPRHIDVSIPIGTLRALAAQGPVMVVAADEEGDAVTQAALPPSLIEGAGTLAESARGDFAALTADPARRCPVYQEARILAT